jgi:hypothetical protein
VGRIETVGWVGGDGRGSTYEGYRRLEDGTEERCREANPNNGTEGGREGYESERCRQ